MYSTGGNWGISVPGGGIWVRRGEQIAKDREYRLEE